MAIIGGVRRRLPAYRAERKAEFTWGGIQTAGAAGLLGVCEALGGIDSPEGLIGAGATGLLLAFLRPIIGRFILPKA